MLSPRSEPVSIREQRVALMPAARKWAKAVILFAFFFRTFACIAQIASSESPADAKINRIRGLDTLSEVKSKLKNFYYDPSFHGLDLDQRFNDARERIKGQQLNSEIFETIADVVLDLNDSHTMFLPPKRFNHVEYGFSLQMMGENCYVVDVKRGSDAEAQGLRIGDRMVKIGALPVSRNTLWQIRYNLYALKPRGTLALTVADDNGTDRVVRTHSRVWTHDEWEREEEQRDKEEKKDPELRHMPYRCHEVGNDLTACKLYSFMVETGEIDKMMKKDVAGHKKLILDLRGNGGGAVETLAHLVGYFFDHPVKVGTTVSRGKTKDLIAKNQGSHRFEGDLVVLVDSESASASEVFARVMQIENRGKVIGDITTGAVMAAESFPLTTARLDTFSVSEIEVTVSDLVMSDGQRLEGKGVVPDVLIVPTSLALVKMVDPTLSHAANLLGGGQLSADDAGKFYFIRRPPEPQAKEKR